MIFHLLYTLNTWRFFNCRMEEGYVTQQMPNRMLRISMIFAGKRHECEGK